MSFNEWLQNGIMARHPDWFLDDFDHSLAHSPNRPVNGPEKPVSVRLEGVVADDWDAQEPEQEEYWK